VFDPWLRGAERERGSALKPPSFPRRVVHTREREGGRVVEGPWARARGPRARDDDEDGEGPWPPMVLLRGLCSYLCAGAPIRVGTAGGGGEPIGAACVMGRRTLSLLQRPELRPP